jgi:hypothetical protein
VVDERSSAYVLLGLRGDLPRHDWALSVSSSYGSGLGQEQGRWLWLDASATRNWYGARHGFALATYGFALGYTEPFEYRAYAAEMVPALTWNLNSVQIIASPRGTAGFWTADTLDGDIGVVGGSLKLAHSFGALSGTISGEAYDATNGAQNGSYGGIGFDLGVSVGSLHLGGGVKRWRNPIESEWGYSAFATKTVSGVVQIEAQLARSVMDPVLASPGSFGASLGVSWRIFSSSRRQLAPVALVTTGRSAGRVVVFTIESDAQTVALSGSFSEWTPIPMDRRGRNFTVEVTVPAGTHHYGFLLNGTDWYVPKNAFGIVDDGFGRKNATLVVERQ